MKKFLLYGLMCVSSFFLLHAQETLEIAISTGIDDVEIQHDGGFDSGSSDLEINGYDGEPQTTYIRFRNITLPADAEITSVYLQFVGDETRSGASSIKVYGEVGTSGIFTNAADANNRTYTNSFITWNTNGSVTGETYRTPDLSSIFSTMFSGKFDAENIGFKLVGNQQGGMTVESYEGSASSAPKLIINYETEHQKIERLINLNYDDAEELVTTGTVYLNNGTLEMGQNLTRATGVRFENITIPSGAQIQDAYIEFYSYGASAGADLVIRNELNNPITYNNNTKNVTGRNYTVRKVEWSTGAWSSSYMMFRTPNLKEIIDENRLGQWQSGQALAFKLDGDGYARAWSRNGSAQYQPKLVIEYLNNGEGPSVGEAPIDETIRAFISQSSNDAEEYLTTGSITLGDGVLEIGGKNGSTPQITGLRFENISIPSGAQIEDAYIEFYSYGNSNDYTEIIFRSELGNASIYSSSRNDISQREYTLRKVKWEVESWSTSNTKYRTPNLKEIIDENRLEGWTSGSSLAFKLEGDGGNIRAWARNGSESYQPRLVIKYLNNNKGPDVGAVPLDETIRTYVSESSNDAEEYLMTGSIDLGSGVLEIGGKDGNRPEVTGIRFENIKIPSDVEITKAYIEFYSYGTNQNPANIIIKNELGNASIYANDRNNITSRDYTIRQVEWTTETWSSNTRYTTPDLKNIIDENRLSGWQTGNALAFIFEGNENTTTRVWARNGSEGYQPRLVIEYVKNGRGPYVGDIPAGGTTHAYISNYNNDAEEYLVNGSIDLGSGVLEVGGIDGGYQQITGLRFENIVIPENAEIEEAYIEFYSYGSNNNDYNDMTLLLYSELGDAAIYENTRNNISDRLYSSRRVKWETQPWTSSSTLYRTPDLKEIIDENRILGWQSGQALAFKIEGFGDAGVLRAWSRNGNEQYQPHLVIKYVNNNNGPSIGYIPYDSVTKVDKLDNDAAEYLETGTVSTGEGILNTGGMEGTQPKVTALRFENVEIPADLEITNAYIEFYSYGTSNNTATITIKAEKTDSAYIYQNNYLNITSRNYTDRKIEWNAGPWERSSVKQQTSNLKDIIDENRLSGWQTGSPLAFIFKGEGEIRAWARNGSEQYQPKLIIEGVKNGKGAEVSELPLEETVSAYVMSYNNDAEEYLTTNAITLGDGALELGGQNGGRPQVTGIRFEGIKIPDDAQIEDAYIEFYSYGSSSRNAEVIIKGELSDDALIYSNQQENITNRDYTQRKIKWTTEPWTRSEQKYRTPNLKEIIDENRLGGWKSDDPLAFKFEGDEGDARAWARNGSTRYQPRLVIKYLRNGEGPNVGEIPLDETIREYISSYSNDVEEQLATGTMRLNDGIIEIAGADGATPQFAGFRFDDVRIPETAEITDAYIEFYSYGNNNSGAEIAIYSEFEGSEEYSTDQYDLTSRLYTNVTSQWKIEETWTANTKYRTPNLKNVIDENRLFGWRSGNALAFKLEGEDNPIMRIWARDGSEQYQPRLVVEYLNNGNGPQIEGVETDVAKMDKLYINELASSGTEEQGSDWIELYNDHDFPVYIEKGVYLSDDEDDKKKHNLKNIYIPAKGFMALYADGSPEEGNKHLDFKLSGSGESVYLSRKVDGEVVVQDSVTFPEFNFNQTYGRTVDGAGDWTIFIEPTYNKTNANSSKKIELAFSKKRGLYPSAFTVALSAENGAVIKYTTDGSYPSETTGYTYTTPITINRNMVLKAYAYANGGYSEIVSHSYFLEDNLSREQGWQYRNNINDAEYAQALQELPIVSISGNSISFNQDYRETSFEFIDNQIDENNETFFSNSGTKRFGAWSYGLASGNYKSKFNKDYGVEKADYPFFDKIKNDPYPAQEISRIELKEGEDGPQVNVFGLGYARLSEKLVMNTFKEMDTYGLSTRLVHLYLNGTYYGVRTLREDFHPNNMEEYFGDDDDNYTEVNLKDGYWDNGIVEAGDGSSEKWNEIRSYIQSRNFQKVKEQVDVDGYIKQLMVYVLMDMENEANAIGHNNSPEYTKFRFVLNDTDGALWNQTGVNCGAYRSKWNSARCSVEGPGNLAGYFIGTREAGFSNTVQYTTVGNLEFKTMLKDRILEFMENEGGALTAEVLNDKINSIQEELDVSYKMDAAYKGFNSSAYESWKENLSRIKQEMPGRVQFVIDKWKQKDLTHSLQAVTVQYANNQVSFANPNQSTKTYYTLDGSDPMGNDGVVSSNAFEYTGGVIELTEDTEVVVRAFTTNNWGPLTGEELEVAVEKTLIFTGIHYNPASDTESEFLLLTNVSEEDVDASGYKIVEGIGFEFPEGARIAANETIVLAKDLATLVGFKDHDQYEWTDGSLSNGGEKIVLQDAAGTMVDEVKYDDEDPWNPLADGDGYYLRLKNTDLDNDLGENWEVVLSEEEASQEVQKTVEESVERSASLVPDEMSVQVYPIPFDDHMNIVFGQEEENIVVFMYDFSGKMVLKKEYSKVYPSQPVQLNTSYLRSGTYFVNIQSSTAKKAIKVTKR